MVLFFRNGPLNLFSHIYLKFSSDEMESFQIYCDIRVVVASLLAKATAVLAV